MRLSALGLCSTQLVIAILRALFAFCGVLLRECQELNKHGTSFLLKKAVSRGLSAWRSRFQKRRLDLYDLEARGDPVKLGFLYPELEWELEAPQPEHKIQSKGDGVRVATGWYRTAAASGVGEDWLSIFGLVDCLVFGGK
ncbi:hypothetical protein HPB47_022553 [Ixodes persulcatus]|uniref:Uncharacterized protein n=1 Tax=Ixodes persulcatus TaxID=34615 RepID=A0AC60Q9T5_IXOPE|nr:hypothetical protein HPB47_022553 [Ixodes persulcatus]